LINATATQDGSVLPVPGMMIEQSVGEAAKAKLLVGQKVIGTLQTIATDYAPFDGTSMATPHVAGVIALIKAANPRLTPTEVRALLATTSTNLGPQLEYGAGIVNAEAAVNKALGR
jgi:serine protease